MPPNSVTVLLRDALGLIGRAFSSIINLIGFFFTSFIRLSPLPDEVDFLLIVLVLIWVIVMIARLFRGKQ